MSHWRAHEAQRWEAAALSTSAGASLISSAGVDQRPRLMSTARPMPRAIRAGRIHPVELFHPPVAASRGKFAGVPSYGNKNRVITQGGIYHVIYYGLNAMGSYASQINEEERWQVALYVEKLRDDLVK